MLCVQVVCEGGTTFTFVRSDDLSVGNNWALTWRKNMGVPWMQYLRQRGDRIAAVVMNRGAHYAEDDKLLPEVKEGVNELAPAEFHMPSDAIIPAENVHVTCV